MHKDRIEIELFRPMCRVKREVDMYTIGLFLIFSMIGLGLLVLAVRSFSYEKFQEDIEKSN